MALEAHTGAMHAWYDVCGVAGHYDTPPPPTDRQGRREQDVLEHWLREHSFQVIRQALALATSARSATGGMGAQVALPIGISTGLFFPRSV